jgi:DNA-binding Lrp family transcriptional regulator
LTTLKERRRRFPAVLDEKDRRILEALRENAKETTKAIAEKTGIPRTTVHDRITKMEDRGVIEQYTVLPDYEALGEPTTAFVFLSYDSRDGVAQEDVAEALSEMEGVYEVHMISGDWDLLAKVRGESVEAIGDLVIQRLRRLGGVGKTLTCTVFRTWKETV